MIANTAPDQPKRRAWWLLVVLLLWVAFLVASVLNLGGNGDLFAVPAVIPILVGLVWVWRWEQGRKAAGRVTYGEELAKGALSGPFTFVYLLIRGPEDSGSE